MNNTNTKKLITAALLAALTCIATMVIKIPTPTFGYIHLGDGFVLLCGIILGPVTGGLAAGIGSMFADIFSSYAAWAPGTFVIKAVTAAIMGIIFGKLQKHSTHVSLPAIIVGGIPAELFMVAGYFLYEILMTMITSAAFTVSAFLAGAAAGISGIVFNVVQGVAGIIICIVLVPVLMKIDDARTLIVK